MSQITCNDLLDYCFDRDKIIAGESIEENQSAKLKSRSGRLLKVALIELLYAYHQDQVLLIGGHSDLLEKLFHWAENSLNIKFE